MQINSTKTYACYLVPLLILLTIGLGFNSAAARTYTSLINGSYDTPGVWDLGSVPGANDTIFIDHDIIRSSGIGFGASCVLTVNPDATLRINGSMINLGKIFIYGSIDVFGNATNNGEIYISPGRKLEVLGDFVNNNLITNDGICIVMGTMVNNATAEGTGHYDVCGTTTNNGYANPTVTLCQICGEKYTNVGTGTYTEICLSLPVELGELTADVFPGYIQLNWTTLTENQTSHFTVERALLDGEFEAVIEVAAAGNSTSVLQYEATDLAPIPGTVSYRLKMVDLDGTTTHSEAVTVTYGSELQAKLTVYPNPSNGQVKLTFQEVPQGELTLRVMDLNGSVIQELITDPYAKNNLSLDLSNLPKGYYILTGAYAGGLVSQKVLIY